MENEKDQQAPGEARVPQGAPVPPVPEEHSTLEVGMLIGLLIGEGHFGGDGKQPQVTLRMHTDHESLFRWLERTFPGGKLYGPYDHGGRRYFQWMVRGRYLREVLVPLLDDHLLPTLDARTYGRYQAMKHRYHLGQLPAPTSSPGI
jgi:hypothetical protein